MASTNRIKNSEPVIKTREEAERVMEDIRDLKIAVADTELEVETRRKQIDEELGPRIAHLNLEIAKQAAQLEAWADANRDQFGKLKSLKMVHGKCGWRQIGPAVDKTVKTSWKKLVDTVKTILGAAYIRPNPEINKEAILEAHKSGKLTDQALAKAGLKIKSHDEFYVVPTIEKSDNRIVPEERRAA